MAAEDFFAPALGVEAVCSAVAKGIGVYDTAGAISSAAGDESVQRITQAMTVVGQALMHWDGADWWFAQDESDMQAFTKTIDTVANTGAKRASNVVTIDITGTTQHNLAAGQWVKVAGVTTATFDGIFEVAAVPDTATFTYNQVDSDVAASGSGTVYVFSYPLRTVNITGGADATTGIMREGYDVQSICFDDDHYLRYVPWREFRKQMRLLDTTGDPLFYTVHGEPPQIFIWPPPNDTKDLHINWYRRHSRIVSSLVVAGTYSTDTALIIPEEFRWGTYVAGSVWLIKHEVTDPAALRDCPEFMDTINRMKAADPSGHDPSNTDDMFPGTTGKYPHNRRVDIDGDQVLIYGSMSV